MDLYRDICYGIELNIFVARGSCVNRSGSNHDTFVTDSLSFQGYCLPYEAKLQLTVLTHFTALTIFTCGRTSLQRASPISLWKL